MTLPHSTRYSVRGLIAAGTAALALGLVGAPAADASTLYAIGGFDSAAKVMQVDLGTNTLGDSIPIPGVRWATPNAEALSPDGRTLIVVGEADTPNGFMIAIDTATRTGSTPIVSTALNTAHAVAFAPDGRTAYIAGTTGVTPYDVATGTLGTTIVPDGMDAAGAWSVAVSPDGTRVFAGTYGRMNVIDAATNTVVGNPISSVALGTDRKAVALGSGPTVFVGGQASSLTRFNGATSAFQTPVGLASVFKDFDPLQDGSALWTLSGNSQATWLSPVDPATGVEGARRDLLPITNASTLAMSPDASTAYVTSIFRLIPVNTQTGAQAAAITMPEFVTDMVVSATTENPDASATPTITTQLPSQSSVIGDPTNPTLKINVAQLDENGDPVPSDELSVRASSSKPFMLPDAGITVAGAGATRTISFSPLTAGYAQVSFTVTGRGGKSATTQINYGASIATTPTSRVLQGYGDASTGINVGGDWTIVADDERTIGLFDLAVSGAPVKTWDNFGIPREPDWESSARAGDMYYVLGSHGNTQVGLADPDRQVVAAARISGSGDDTELTPSGSFTGLLRDMIAWDRANANRLGLWNGPIGPTVTSESAVNIEGAEFAPGSSSTLYLGLRTPVTPKESATGKAIVVPWTNVDRALRGKDDRATFGDPILLDLGGLSIREIRKNAGEQYVILANRNNNSGGALFSWSGDPADAPVRLTTTLPQSPEQHADDAAAWEGIAKLPEVLTAGGQIRLIMDQGEEKLYLPDVETKNKQNPDVQLKKSRTDVFTLAGNVGAAAEATAPTFAAQAAGTVGSGRWVRFTNTGAQKLTVARAFVFADEEASAGDFVAGQDTCAGTTVAVGASCRVLVRFAPARAEATSVASLVLTANVAGGAVRVPLTATSTGAPIGAPGRDGDDGAQGPTGAAGRDGSQGPTGSAGRDGSQGATGSAGRDGATGPGGPVGPSGSAGPAGPAGRAGAKGDKGDPGRVVCAVKTRRSKVSISCQQRSAARRAAARLVRGGRTYAKGSLDALRPTRSLKAGRYTLVIGSGRSTRTAVVTVARAIVR